MNKILIMQKEKNETKILYNNFFKQHPEIKSVFDDVPRGFSQVKMCHNASDNTNIWIQFFARKNKNIPPKK